MDNELCDLKRYMASGIRRQVLSPKTAAQPTFARINRRHFRWNCQPQNWKSKKRQRAGRQAANTRVIRRIRLQLKKIGSTMPQI